jgi:RND family efflux transporter MFP subunit
MGLALGSCSGDSQKESSTQNRIQVTASTASLDNQAQQLTYSAKVEAAQFANLSTRISGTIDDILVHPGQKVKKGAVLLKINNRDLLAKKAQIQAAQTATKQAYDIASKDLKRFTKLYEQKSASLKELENVQSNHKAMKANYDMTLSQEKELNAMLKYSIIRAPYGGVITTKYKNIGELANPGMPLIGIEKAGAFNVQALIPESDITHLNVGDNVEVKIKSAGLETVKAKIIEINPSAKQSLTQYELKIALHLTSEQAMKLRSGMFANVIMKRDPVACITIPQNALIKKGQLTGVYTISSTNTALLRWVRTGKTNGDRIEILSGLSEGEKYIQSYQGKIWDGAAINIK